jgi:hypothetical protein
MRQKATIELYQYWNGLRDGRPTPGREEIDPLAIRHILADTMILEADADRAFPVCISGTRLNALFLDEQKGRSFTSLFAPSDRRTASAMILSMLNGARPVIAGLSAAPEDGAAASLELLLLPLRPRGKEQARILGALSPVVTPSWLGLRRAECLRVITMRFVDDDPATEAFDDSPRRLAQRMRASRRDFSVIAGGRPRHDGM